MEETKRLRHLLMIVLENSESIQEDEGKSQIYEAELELQTVRKKNSDLRYIMSQTNNELDSLKAKLNILQRHKKKHKLKKKLAKLKSEYENHEKIIKDNKNSFEIKEKELMTRIKNVRILGIEKLQLLKELENKHKCNNMVFNDIIQDLESKNNKKIDIENFKNPETTNKTPKLSNPPRLLIKMHQILKKKKMFISVLLSLLDKNSNGLIYIDNLIKGLSLYGKKIKKKYIQEILNIIGTTSNYIALRILEDLYDDYEYNNINYLSSSDDEVKINKKNITRLSFSNPEQDVITVKTVETSNNILNTVSDRSKNLAFIMIPTVNLSQINELLNEIKLKMSALNLPKVKLISILFGSNFDPDELISRETLINYFMSSSLKFQNLNDIQLITNFLLEPINIKKITIEEANNLKGSIREINQKLQKILPDWSLFTECEEKKFEELLKDKVSNEYKKIRNLCLRIDKNNEGIIKIEELLKVFFELNIIVSDKMSE